MFQTLKLLFFKLALILFNMCIWKETMYNYVWKKWISAWWYSQNMLWIESKTANFGRKCRIVISFWPQSKEGFLKYDTRSTNHKEKFDVFYYFEEKILLYIERHKGKDSHMFQLLWNYLTVHVLILQPSISTPSHMPWRNSCTCEPGDLYKDVYCIFIIEKNWK